MSFCLLTRLNLLGKRGTLSNNRRWNGLSYSTGDYWAMGDRGFVPPSQQKRGLHNSIWSTGHPPVPVPPRVRQWLRSYSRRVLARGVSFLVFRLAVCGILTSWTLMMFSEPCRPSVDYRNTYTEPTGRISLLLKHLWERQPRHFWQVRWWIPAQVIEHSSPSLPIPGFSLFFYLPLSPNWPP